MNPNKISSAVIFSDFNNYSHDVAKELISKNISVDIVSSDKRRWKNIGETFSKENYRITKDIDRVFYFCGFRKPRNAVREFYSYFKNGVSQKAKTFLVLPKKSYPVDTSNIFSVNKNIGIVYLERGATPGETLVNWALSIGPYGKETVIKKTPKKIKIKTWLPKVLSVLLLSIIISFFLNRFSPPNINELENEKIAFSLLTKMMGGSPYDPRDEIGLLAKNLGKEELSEQVLELIGVNGMKKYLVVFVNNDQLRPSGGVVDSYSIVSIDGGRISDISTDKVSDADSQLKGRIEPPAMLAKYLNKTNWYFADSGWYPDFSMAATRMEWFLDKEVDQQVDGVISVDRTALEEIVEFGEVGPENFHMFLKSLGKNLKEKHIQIFLHNDLAQEAASEIGWAGTIPTSKDFIIPIEANVGGNDINSYIRRDEKLTILHDGEDVYYNFVLTLNNSAKPLLGKNGIYKVYFSLGLPKTAQFLGAKELYDRGHETMEVDGDLGVYTEVLPGRSKKIQYSWRNTGVPGEEYEIYIHKQAGTQEDSFTLTLDGKTVYNSTLDQSLWLK